MMATGVARRFKVGSGGKRVNVTALRVAQLLAGVLTIVMCEMWRMACDLLVARILKVRQHVRVRQRLGLREDDGWRIGRQARGGEERASVRKGGCGAGGEHDLAGGRGA